MLVQADAQPPGLGHQRRLAGQLAHQHALHVAHAFGTRVLVRLGEPRDGARMQAALVRECRRARVRMVRRHRQVARLGHELRHAGQVAQAVLPHARAAHLQFQVGHHGEQVAVAHALAEAVHRALHLGGAGTHGGQRVRHGATGVVVAVDAQLLAWQRGGHGGHDLAHLVRQRAAVRLAEVDGVRTGLAGRTHAGQRIVRVRLVAVEEVLGVEHDAPAMAFQVGHRVADHAQVLLERGQQRARDLFVPRLPHDGDHGGLACQQVGQALVVGGRHALLAGRAERGHLRMLERHGAHALEEGDVLGIRRRKAALYEVDAELVEPRDDAQLVLQRQRHAFALLSVPQRAVVGEDSIQAACILSAASSSSGGWKAAGTSRFRSTSRRSPRCCHRPRRRSAPAGHA